MVTGIERWKEYFNEYKDKYVLIGGAACNLLEEELLPLGRKEDFDFFMINHVVLDGISRLAKQNSSDRDEAITTLRRYAHEKIPSLLSCKSFYRETRNRRIIMLLNYYGMEQLAQKILRMKSRR